MLTNYQRRLLLSVVLFLITGYSSAGPSFNSNREELAAISVKAGGQVQKGLAAFHEMLYQLEYKRLDAVEIERSNTIQRFNEALGTFEQLADRAPNQALVLDTETEDVRRAVARLRQRLNEHSIEFPETEKELARVAIDVVNIFLNRLQETKLDGSTNDHHELWETIQVEAFLEEVGILVSIAWAASSRS